MSAALYSPADLAAIFGGEVTPRKVLDWRKEHGWPCVKVGRTIRFTDEQVEHILASHTVTASADAPAELIEGQTSRSAKRSAA